MRKIGQVGQIVCTCGRVAELRTRKNGKRLPFLQCKHCGMKQGKEALRNEWLAAEDATCSLGTYGEFPVSGKQTSSESSNNPSKTAEPEQKPSSKQTSSKAQTEWSPPDELLPEVLEPQATDIVEEGQETSNESVGIGLKVLGSVATIVLFMFGAKKIKSINKFKG